MGLLSLEAFRLSLCASPLCKFPLPTGWAQGQRTPWVEEGHHTWTVVPSCSGASRSIRIPLEFLGNSVLSVPSPQLSPLWREREQHKGVLVAESPPAVGHWWCALMTTGQKHPMHGQDLGGQSLKDEPRLKRTDSGRDVASLGRVLIQHAGRSGFKPSSI